VRSRCFSFNLTNEQPVELAFQGLLLAIKDRYSAQEFESLGHIIRRVSAHESRYQDSRGGQYQMKVACMGSLESDSEEDNEIGLAEWTRNKIWCHVHGSRPLWKSTALTLIKPIRYLISC
jgi:hypothetical protein